MLVIAGGVFLGLLAFAIVWANAGLVITAGAVAFKWVLIAAAILLVLGAAYWEVAWALHGFPFPSDITDKILFGLVNFFWYSVLYGIFRDIQRNRAWRASQISN